MTSGTTSSATRTAIRHSLADLAGVVGIWGFGSFFRGDEHRDVDVLIVVAPCAQPLLEVSRAIRARLLDLAGRLCVPIDPLILTADEFDEGPLRDMHELVPIM